MSRRAARVDANHGAIRDALRACGWTVLDTSKYGHGFPDLLAVKDGRLEFIEVKDGTKPPSERRLTAEEHAFMVFLWKAERDLRVILSVEEAVQL